MNVYIFATDIQTLSGRTWVACLHLWEVQNLKLDAALLSVWLAYCRRTSSNGRARYSTDLSHVLSMMIPAFLNLVSYDHWAHKSLSFVYSYSASMSSDVDPVLAGRIYDIVYLSRFCTTFTTLTIYVQYVKYMCSSNGEHAIIGTFILYFCIPLAARQTFIHELSKRHKALYSQHFVECVYHFNDFMDHKSKIYVFYQ